MFHGREQKRPATLRAPAPRTLIVPGIDASPAPHWQHWWAQRDPTALVVEQADWSNPHPDRWEVELGSALLTHPGAFLVGHSLGAALILRVLTRWPQLRASGALLVAVAEPSRSPRTAAFGPLPEVPLPIPVTVAASRDDPWMDFDRARHLAHIWGARLVDLGHAGHVNPASGFGPWPQGPALRDEMLAEAAAERRRSLP
ncbi:RBBP9/YdeN family alpha/beta hydrolase [Paenirhodobacter sp.]|uniref:RBBP9/YdeN family alpha/beta hydrolase n=1 Tax=Paenirhodobacter sp. TaxID=1965326 RepID=UPI003B40A3C7